MSAVKTVLAALNAAYVHTALGVRTVAAYARRQGVEHLVVWERTINHRRRRLLQELWAEQAQVVVFSCYIWNIALVRSLAADLRLLCPDIVLVAAGPEVSYHCDAFLADNPAFDLVLPGEGEAATAALLLELAAAHRAKTPLRRCPAVTRRRANGGAAPVLAMDALPFPYRDPAALAGRILYYESMRGCPFRCSYCLSAVQPGVRLRSLPLVLNDLQRLLQSGARQVKFVDRTFNCDKLRALQIWRFLMEHDNGVTGFHFELAGELLDEQALALLAAARPGLFQFEIGVQSCNPQTLAAICRPCDPAHLLQRVQALEQAGNIHLHLDLIAGLPLEDLPSFARSFDLVYRAAPHQLQLGFLKVLRGSEMERQAGEHGIVYQTGAPYEVLATRWLSFAELDLLHGVADMVELYHNSGRFSHLLAAILQDCDSPFAFYRALSTYYTAQGHRDAPPSKVAYYEILGGFLAQNGRGPTERHQWLCKYDMALHEKPRRLPDWVTVARTPPHRERILAALADTQTVARLLPGREGSEPKHLLRVAHVEVFPFHPATGEEGEVAMLFCYDTRDLFGRAQAHVLFGPNAETNA